MQKILKCIVSLATISMVVISPLASSLPAFAKAGYAINGSHLVNEYKVSLYGTASAYPYVGQINQQHVSVDWGKNGDTEPNNWEELPSPYFLITDYSTIDKHFNASWQTSTVYAAPGTYTVFVSVYHGNISGAEGSDWATLPAISVTVPTYICGNEVVDPGEQCDDGDVIPGDGCSATCQIEILSTWYLDADGDGYGDSSVSTSSISQPQGYISDNTDCDDSDGNINPGANEICNSKDDNCNGEIDENDVCVTPTTWYLDADSDGYGDPTNSTSSISQPQGYVSDSTDCDDSDSTVHPNATEICGDTIDQDCDGNDPTCPGPTCTDNDGDGFSIEGDSCGAIDCDDNSSTTYPGAPEICGDDIDQNCNGIGDIIDPACPPPLTIKAYKILCQSEDDLPNWGNGSGPNVIDQYTAPNFLSGHQSCQLAQGWEFEWAYDGDVSAPTGNLIGTGGTGWNAFNTQTGTSTPAEATITDLQSHSRLWVKENLQQSYIPFSDSTEAPYNDVSAEMYCGYDILNYDNYDYIDEVQLGATYYCVGFNAPICTDADGDGYYKEGQICGTTADCDDNTSTTYSGAPELCDNADNNCDGNIDENITRPTSCGLGICSQNTGTETCTAGEWGGDTCNPFLGAKTEICGNEVDEDCSGADLECTATTTWYRDADGDGYGNPGNSTTSTSTPEGYVADNTDCSDVNASVHPGATEICGNGIDEDCSGSDASCGGPGPGPSGPTSLSIFNEQVVISSIGTSGATVIWNTNKDANSQLVFGAYNESHTYNLVLPNYGYSSANTLDAILLGSHSMVLSGLLPGTTYYVRSVSKTAIESAISTELMFTTSGVLGEATQTVPVVPLAPLAPSEQEEETLSTGEVAGVATQTQESVAPTQETQETNNNPSVESAAVAQVSAFTNFCWLTMILLVLLTAWHIFDVIKKRKKGEKEEVWLPAAIAILIVLLFWKCCKCCGLGVCWVEWLFVIINVLVFAFSMITKGKKEAA